MISKILWHTIDQMCMPIIYIKLQWKCKMQSKGIRNFAFKMLQVSIELGVCALQKRMEISAFICTQT